MSVRGSYGRENDVNEIGEIVREEWERTAAVRPNVELGEYIVMPNHFHGILVFIDDGAYTVGATLAKHSRREKGRPYKNNIAIGFIGCGDGTIQIHRYKTDQCFAQCDRFTRLAAQLLRTYHPQR